ncbi:MAG: creatininase family protein [Actinomycetota bacterium]|nr:creatininase family protein [Actinomycetota bacterium]
MSARVHHLKEMTWQDVERFDRETSVVMSACGPIEQHGPQTPLGTDLYIAEYVMHRCAEHLAEHDYSVIVAPTVPYVNALFSLPYPGSVSIRRRVVEGYLFDLLASFAADGFRHLVLTSQHVDPPWVQTAQEVCERVNEEHGARAIHGFERFVVDLLEDPSLLGSSGLDSEGEAHAGVYETAPMLYIREGLVRKRLLEELPPQRIEFSQFGEAESFRELGNGLGYTGNLSQATEEIGGRIIEHYAERFKELILRHVRGEDVYEHLRFSGF